MLLATYALTLLALQDAPAHDEAGGDELKRKNRIYVVDTSPDGTVVAAGYGQGRVALHDAASGEPLSELEPALFDSAWALRFAPDGKRLAGLGRDGRLVLWSLDDGADAEEPALGPLRGLPPIRRGYPFYVSMAWSPDGGRLALANRRGKHSLWNPDGELVLRWSAACPADPLLAWTPDARLLLTVDDAVLQVRDADSGKTFWGEGAVDSIDCGAAVTALAVHGDGRLVATGHPDVTLRLWDLETGELVHELRTPDPTSSDPDDDVGALAFSPSGDRLAHSIREGSHVWVTDLESREEVWGSDFLGAHFIEAMELRWSPDGSRLWYAFACGGGRLYCVDPRSGAEGSVVVDRGRVPRFGGELGAIPTAGELGVVRFDGERVR